MKRTLAKKAAVALAAVSVFTFLNPVLAQDADAAGDEPAKAEEGELAPQSAAKPAQVFLPLMRCLRAEGQVQVLKPRTEAWVDAEEGRLYPLGSTIRVNGTVGASPEAVFEFGDKATIRATAAAEFATREIELGSSARTVVLKSGAVDIKLPLTLKEGAFSVTAPFFTASNLAGESQFDYKPLADGDETLVRCVTGTLTLQGRHYKIAKMRAADQIRIRTTGDDLFTSLLGEIGDCKVTLDQGVERKKEVGDNGSMIEKDVPRTLEFGLFPQYEVKIFRRAAEVGGRMIVSMMTFDQAGEMKNRCAFAEGLAIVNSGELVVATKISETDAKKEKAAEKDDSETVEDDATEASDEKKSDAAGEAGSEEKPAEEAADDSDI